jgi:hypothetical protein
LPPSVATDDGNGSVRRLCSENGVPHERDDRRLIVPPAAAGGTVLTFAPD